MISAHHGMVFLDRGQIEPALAALLPVRAPTCRGLDAPRAHAQGCGMEITPTPLPGVLVLTPQVHRDSRGSFSESWSRRRLAQAGIELDFVQENHSFNRAAGTLRGLHCQAAPAAQDKLVRVAAGAIWDVAVDVRRGSPHYGRWIGVELSADNARQLLVPRGFLHGFVTRAPDTSVIYKTTDYYAPETERAVHFADPDLAIDWGIAPDRVLVSEKDAAAPAFAGWESPFVQEEA